MTKKEKIAPTVQRIIAQVLEETYDTEIFDEIWHLREFLISPCDIYYIDVYIPSFLGFSISEIKKSYTELEKKLLQEINHTEISYLRTMRIVKALDSLATDLSKMKISNPKVKFCQKLLSNDISNQFKVIHLLDKM